MSTNYFNIRIELILRLSAGQQPSHNTNTAFSWHFTRPMLALGLETVSAVPSEDTFVVARLRIVSWSAWINHTGRRQTMADRTPPSPFLWLLCIDNRCCRVRILVATILRQLFDSSVMMLFRSGIDRMAIDEIHVKSAFPECEC
jgi:hypothetical protein